MNKTLHPKSIKLLERVEQRMKDSTFRNKLYKRLIDEVTDFYWNTPPEELTFMLINKMTIGGLEYGEPNYTPEQIKFEKKQEMLDIMGWDFTGEDL